MTTDILIVTFKRDFPYLEWCFRSIKKFATGFNAVHVVIPSSDREEASKQFSNEHIGTLCVWHMMDEWEGKGMLHHMYQIMCSDLISDADFICHIDADCIFTGPVTPETFVKKDRPILQYERFDSIGKRHPACLEWKRVTERCLPFDILYETMRQHGETYHRITYAEARRLIKLKTGMDAEQYISRQKNEFPNGFCEFVTLGNVAMHCFPDRYHTVDSALKPNPEKGIFPVGQFWSLGRIDLPQETWWEGKLITLVPIHMIKNTLQLT